MAEKPQKPTCPSLAPVDAPGCATRGMLACVCEIIRLHGPDCKFRRSATCAIGIECKHGRDTCPICDPCTCVPIVEIKPPQVGKFFHKVKCA